MSDHCDEPGCEAALKPGASGRVSAWAKIKAHDAGWFQMKDGTLYCPQHVPGWVAAWRARKQQTKETE